MAAISELKARLADVNALNAAVSIMDWDQQTYMPRGGAEARGQHVSILTRMAHEIFTADETKRLLEKAKSESDPNSDDAALIRVATRDVTLASKLPADLVERKSKLTTEAHEVWVDARKNNDFGKFAPYLEQLLDIARQEAECFGYQEHIYDALLDTYEEGATAADVRAMFDAIRTPLVDLVKRIQASPNQPNDSKFYGNWDKEKQREFTEMLVKEIGFDMERGRQDVAPHPFCTGWSVGDIRLTTRYKDYLPSAIMGSLHEAGHGMYEQGSPKDWDLTPLAGGVSLGLHESQSRLWENIVGRSKAFWTRFLPDLKAKFDGIESFDVDSFVFALNKVQPSLIRVEADEVTYNLHIMVRFEMECDLLEGALKIKDVPEVWNQKYQDYLGVRPDSDANGCLQDVHWSMGGMGYFPTYSMGNLLSYQIWNKLRADLGDTDALMASGNFAPIFEWLRDKIYRQGRKYTPRDLVQQVTGKPMGAEDYLAGITAKYEALYRL